MFGHLERKETFKDEHETNGCPLHYWAVSLKEVNALNLSSFPVCGVSVQQPPGLRVLGTPLSFLVFTGYGI